MFKKTNVTSQEGEPWQIYRRPLTSMSSRPGTHGTKPWVVVAGILFAALVIAVIEQGIRLSQVHQEVYKEYANSRQEAERKKQFKERCDSITAVVELRRCFEQQIDSSWDTQKDQEDLYAQKQMADWAWWMVILTMAIGVPSICLTGFGIWLVYLNLREAQHITIEAIKHTQVAEQTARIAERQLVVGQRPWVSAHIGIESAVTIKDGEFIVEVIVRMKNYGQSPAISVDVNLEVVPMIHNAIREKDRIVNDIKKRPRKNLGQKIFPTDTFTFAISTKISADAISKEWEGFNPPPERLMLSPAIIGCISYFSTNHAGIQPEVHITEFMAWLGRRNPDHPKTSLAFFVDDQVVPPEDIVVQLAIGTGDAT